MDIEKKGILIVININLEQAYEKKTYIFERGYHPLSI